MQERGGELSLIYLCWINLYNFIKIIPEFIVF